MADIVVTALRPLDRARWTQLWHGYLDFYKTELPPEIYEHTWQRLTAAESPIRGLGARLGGTNAPLDWTTKKNNAAARSLYDRLAWFSGFIRYDYALD